MAILTGEPLRAPRIDPLTLSGDKWMSLQGWPTERARKFLKQWGWVELYSLNIHSNPVPIKHNTRLRFGTDGNDGFPLPLDRPCHVRVMWFGEMQSKQRGVLLDAGRRPGPVTPIEVTHNVGGTRSIEIWGKLA